MWGAYHNRKQPGDQRQPGAASPTAEPGLTHTFQLLKEPDNLIVTR